MPTRSYVILGTGALGGYYGGLLARHGFDTRFLLRSDFDHARTHGLRIDTRRPPGDFTIPAERLQAFGSPADLPPSDVAVLCTKTTHNDQLPDLLARCLKPDGVVLVLQNGLDPERSAAEIVGPNRVLGGLCFLCSNKLGPGHIQHLDYGRIHAGLYDPAEDTPAAQHLPGVVADFNAAGIETLAVDDLRLARWNKLVWNIPYNGLSVVLNQTTDVMMADPATRQRIETIMHEVQAAARAVDGRAIEDAFIDKMLADTARMRPYKTSMMLDYDHGRPTEARSIIHDPCAAAAAAGCAVPHIDRLATELANLEAADLPLAHRRLPRFAFGDSDESADALARLVVAGVKTATCWADDGSEPLPAVGDRSIVLDARGRPVALIETTAAERRRFNQVDESFAAAEGEDDRTLATWRADHRAFFEREGNFAEDMPLICERFRLLECLTDPSDHTERRPPRFT
ncbi:MAG: 2-dehydropantoate 2-reductase [Planctomycetota bacterium]